MVFRFSGLALAAVHYRALGKDDKNSTSACLVQQIFWPTPTYLGTRAVRSWPFRVQYLSWLRGLRLTKKRSLRFPHGIYWVRNTLRCSHAGTSCYYGMTKWSASQSFSMHARAPKTYRILNSLFWAIMSHSSLFTSHKIRDFSFPYLDCLDKITLRLGLMRQIKEISSQAVSLGARIAQCHFVWWSNRAGSSWWKAKIGIRISFVPPSSRFQDMAPG